MPGQCVFNVHWLEDELYTRWLMLVADQRKACCKLCLKDIDIGNVGESALKRHAASSKHLIKFLEKDMKVVDFRKPASATTAKKSCNTISQDKNSSSVFSPHTTGGASVSSQETLSAEILWTLKSLQWVFSTRQYVGSITVFWFWFGIMQSWRVLLWQTGKRPILCKVVNCSQDYPVAVTWTSRSRKWFFSEQRGWKL